MVTNVSCRVVFNEKEVKVVEIVVNWVKCWAKQQNGDIRQCLEFLCGRVIICIVEDMCLGASGRRWPGRRGENHPFSEIGSKRSTENQADFSFVRVRLARSMGAWQIRDAENRKVRPKKQVSRPGPPSALSQLSELDGHLASDNGFCEWNSYL